MLLSYMFWQQICPQSAIYIYVTCINYLTLINGESTQIYMPHIDLLTLTMCQGALNTDDNNSNDIDNTNSDTGQYGLPA